MSRTVKFTWAQGRFLASKERIRVLDLFSPTRCGLISMRNPPIAQLSYLSSLMCRAEWKTPPDPLAGCSSPSYLAPSASRPLAAAADLSGFSSQHPLGLALCLLSVFFSLGHWGYIRRAGSLQSWSDGCWTPPLFRQAGGSESAPQRVWRCQLLVCSSAKPVIILPSQ